MFTEYIILPLSLSTLISIRYPEARSGIFEGATLITIGGLVYSFYNGYKIPKDTRKIQNYINKCRFHPAFFPFFGLSLQLGTIFGNIINRVD